MRKLLMALVAGTLLSLASAFELPSDAQVVIQTDSQVVGEGSLEDGDLHLELLASFSGFATVTVIDSTGDVMSFEVMISADGSIALAQDVGVGGAYLVDLVSGEVVIGYEESFEDRVRARAQDAAAHARARHEAAEARAHQEAAESRARHEAALARARHEAAEARARHEAAEARRAELRDRIEQVDEVRIEGRVEGEASLGVDGDREGGFEADLDFRFGLGGSDD